MHLQTHSVLFANENCTFHTDRLNVSRWLEDLTAAAEEVGNKTTRSSPYMRRLTRQPMEHKLN